ncbi:MAG: DNA cytosine methyltransferase [Candidatus Methanoperedens sp.]|jgi:DNA (cytosine-5)-methyltransferase 1|nr:DNA cytosine methyltransferase [Candidatus Methanoperedens sp.]PKL54002.1 MAG: DNA (cytosine-5-)-methyltransferase [Candidatus Methanoperedenaceae archaeon HGW-Methanoperedenaceae-1]
MNKIRFLDLFAGAGGLSEGFIRAGYSPVAHVEVDLAACYTLKTRMAYHWLKDHGRTNAYCDYLHGKISRYELYEMVPESLIASVINAKIGKESLPEIFRRIDELLDKESLDLIIGGPPCQAYSLVGRSRDKNRMQFDMRNYLYVYYAEFLKRYQPRYFVFENVSGLLSAKSPEGVPYFESMRGLFQETGYKTEYRVLSADNYGVPQKRKRIILVGSRGNENGFYPEPEIWHPQIKVSEIFRDLPELQAGDGSILPCHLKECTGQYLYEAGIRNDDVPVTLHQSRPHSDQDLEIYRIAARKWNENHERLTYNDLPERLKTHQNRSSFLDRFKVVASDVGCSHTVVAHISKDGHYYIHPDINQNRSITPREAARLQTFPDDYFFEGMSEKPGRTAAYRQIGNAVPVLLSQKIAEKLKEVW